MEPSATKVMQYFLIKNHAATGPFPKEQLLEKGLTQNSLVWHEGLPDWVKAIEIEDLQDLFLVKENAPVKTSNVRVVITASIAFLLLAAVIHQARHRTKGEYQRLEKRKLLDQF